MNLRRAFSLDGPHLVFGGQELKIKRPIHSRLNKDGKKYKLPNNKNLKESNQEVNNSISSITSMFPINYIQSVFILIMS